MPLKVVDGIRMTYNDIQTRGQDVSNWRCLCLRVVKNFDSFQRELSRYGYDVTHLQYHDIQYDACHHYFDVSLRWFVPQWERGVGSGHGLLSDGRRASEQTTSMTCRPTMYLAEFSTVQVSAETSSVLCGKCWKTGCISGYHIRGHAKVFRREGQRLFVGILIPRKSPSWVLIGQSWNLIETWFWPGEVVISVSW